jgi:uncharacterized protein YecE (DUF72 family)
MELFNTHGVPPQATRLAPKLRALADRRIFFGTSSWKYDGWLGSIYSEDRYLTRGKFSNAKFEQDCLTEYAETFPTVCGDLTFYQFPTEQYWAKLFDAVPENFIFGFKVPEDITVSTWPKHARYGQRAGLANERFLDPETLEQFFTSRLEPYGKRVGPLIFEFGAFNKSAFPSRADFMARLDHFLKALPQGFQYAVEIRNMEFLRQDYLAVLASNKVAHVFNSWTRMPSLDKQSRITEAFTANFTVVRALLRSGRDYEKAVESFEPYRQIKEVCQSARDGMTQIVNECLRQRKTGFIFVNNRLEGNAPATIEAVVARMESGSAS